MRNSILFLHAGQLVKHRHIRLDVLQMLPAVIGHTDLIQWDAQPLADQVALVITDGEHPPGKPFGGKAVEPELEAEKRTVGFHYQGADIMQHHHAAAGHEHIAGKANVKIAGKRYAGNACNRNGYAGRRFHNRNRCCKAHI